MQQRIGVLATQAAALGCSGPVAGNSPGKISQLVVHGQTAILVMLANKAAADQSVQVRLGRFEAASVREFLRYSTSTARNQYLHVALYALWAASIVKQAHWTLYILAATQSQGSITLL